MTRQRLGGVLVLAKERSGLLVPDDLKGKAGLREWERFLSADLPV